MTEVTRILSSPIFAPFGKLPKIVRRKRLMFCSALAAIKSALHRILVDQARRKQADKRGAGPHEPPEHPLQLFHNGRRVFQPPASILGDTRIPTAAGKAQRAVELTSCVVPLRPHAAPTRPWVRRERRVRRWPHSSRPGQVVLQAVNHAAAEQYIRPESRFGMDSVASMMQKRPRHLLSSV